jgi:(1->4)-alpha-D-glucan 1-alpha-D-glucosylmutase
LTTELDLVQERRVETGHLKAELARLYATFSEVAEFVDENLRQVNGERGDPASFDLLDRLLGEQAYRLAFWRVASVEINYRRFFDIADLVAMRIEDEDVFEARHARLVEMLAAGQLHGLRIDHIDGLHDPRGYLDRLQAFLTPGRASRTSANDATYIVVEKILADGERLPTGWATAGTTGYDFLNLVNGLFVDAGATRQLDDTFRRVTGVEAGFAEIAYQQKRRVMAELFSGDVRAMVQRLDALSLHDRHGRDLTQRELGQALSEVTARFPVYRTYTRAGEVRDEDRAWIEQAIAASLARRSDLRRALSFLRRLLLLEYPGYLPDEQREAWLAFVMRWQQFSGPIMAKGHEDTALYIYNRIVSVNDVGGEPAELGLDVAVFHARNALQLAEWPHALNTTSTHDTKRSEDVRARINVLSEMPAEWDARVERWRAWNARHKREVDGQPAPDGNTEYLLYQTLIGAWPLDGDLAAFRERLKAYLHKATREAKVHTSWIHPRLDFEDAVAAFVDAVLSEDATPFLSDLRDVAATIVWYGALNSLSQLLLKLTVPGVPDIYQGTELWDLSLVDPDNRRPVDFALRARLLAEQHSGGVDPGALLRAWQDGRVKLHVTRATLALRNTHPELFADGDYLPLDVTGAHARHVVAYARRHGADWAVVVAPRLLLTLARATGIRDGESPLGESAWCDTAVRLPAEAPAAWRDTLGNVTCRADGAAIRVADALAGLPVALLIPASKRGL